VIIPAYNEARYIADTLRALARVAAPAPAEIIVVDNGSTDDTVALAGQAGARVLVRPGVSVAALRNAGRAEASGDVLAFLDADCIPSPDWLHWAIASMQDGGPSVTGSRVALPENGSWVERAWFSVPPQGRRHVPYINSGNLVVTRGVFDRVGGFDETLISGEDSDFCRRASLVAPVIADDRIRVVHHGNPKTVRQFFAREIWHGMGALGSSARSLGNKPLLGAIAVLVLTLGQALGLALWIAGSGPAVTAVSTAALVLLVGASAVHRARSLAPGRLL
jgi:glycosyltransferase involved in cell wall biosynthesis